MECYNHPQSQRPTYECLLFDLDDTLYPYSSGLATECAKNIGDYMVEKLGIDKSKVPYLCSLLYKNYGTTMAGLRAIGYNFDYDDYHSIVHGRLPYDRLKPDPLLRHILLSLPIRKVIFTNGDKVHAAKVISRLGLEDCFEGIICFETLNPPADSTISSTDQSGILDIVDHLSRHESVDTELPKTPILCKPSEFAMEYALKLANIDPHKTVFFDDSARNIEAGKRIGLHTVLVGTCRRTKAADHAVEHIHNIKEALPELWEEVRKSDNIRYTDKVAVETPVTV